MDFQPTGIQKSDYLDLIEKVVDAYGTELLEKQLELEDGVYHFTAFRTSVMLAYLLNAGRRPELLPLWRRVTEKSVRALEHSRNSAYNDLTLEELCLSFMLMPKEVQPRWMEVLRRFDPRHQFKFMSKDQMNNMVVYGAVGMFLREKLTGESCAAHFDMVMPWILERIDEKGMFDDHDHALLYDLTTRVRLEQLLWHGYTGRWADQIRQALCRGGLMTLRMQSAAFQIPYGGRSNQFLHNEALQASLCEYEAVRWKNQGNMELAGAFKRAAALSLLTVRRYLDVPEGPKHIRNRFPQDSLYGIDHYGTFPRYMNALATFAACGYLACDDSIPETPCPAETGGYLEITTERFGKLFANVGGQSLEYAFLADPEHEAAGLGRYHKVGVPAELGLSMPFTDTPVYSLSTGRIPFDILGPNPVIGEYAHYMTDRIPARCTGFSPGVVAPSGERLLFCQNGAPQGYKILEESDTRISFQVFWQEGTETITLDREGLWLSCELRIPGTAFWSVPLLESNGGEAARITLSEGSAGASLEGAAFSVSTSALLTDTKERCGNRNGIYRIFHADSDTAACSVRLVLSKI